MKKTPRPALTLLWIFAFWMAAAAVFAQAPVFDVEMSPSQAETMPHYEIVIGDDVDAGELYRFARECEERAAVPATSDWFRTRVSSDDRLECRFHAPTGRLETRVELTAGGKKPAMKGRSGSQGGSGIIKIRFEAKFAEEQRVRLGVGAAWSEWSRQPVVREVRIPGEGEERTLHFDLEMLVGPELALVHMSGYVKVKKLHSGG